MAIKFKQQSECPGHALFPTGDWGVSVKEQKARKHDRDWRGSSSCKTHEDSPNPPKDWQSLRGALSHIAGAVESSRKILDLLDDDGNRVVTRAAWERAANFLNNSSRRLWAIQGIKIETPYIGPGPDGSVDIHWDRPNYEMLINVPADNAEPITFYGDDRCGNAVKGKTASHDNRGLLLWLTTVMNK